LARPRQSPPYGKVLYRIPSVRQNQTMQEAVCKTAAGPTATERANCDPICLNTRARPSNGRAPTGSPILSRPGRNTKHGVPSLFFRITGRGSAAPAHLYSTSTRSILAWGHLMAAFVVYSGPRHRQTTFFGEGPSRSDGRIEPLANLTGPWTLTRGGSDNLTFPCLGGGGPPWIFSFLQGDDQHKNLWIWT